MQDLELNKIAAAVLVGGLTMMVVGKVAGMLYHAGEVPEKRGYSIEVAEVEGAGPVADKGPENILAFMGKASAERGEKLIKACVSCHSFDQGGPNKVGPNLWNIVGTDMASKEGFAYSNAMKEHGGNWSFQSLSEFFTKPGKYIKGTKMAYAGMKKPQQRADLIAYLRSLSDSPVDIPEYVPEVPALDEDADIPIVPTGDDVVEEIKAIDPADEAEGTMKKSKDAVKDVAEEAKDAVKDAKEKATD